MRSDYDSEKVKIRNPGRRRGPILVIVLTGLLLLPGSAMARVTLVPARLTAEANGVVSLRVLAGCIEDDGPKPTKRIEVTIPEGVVFVRPFPKPGWRVKTVVDELPEPVTVNDQTIVRGVRKIIWRIGSEGGLRTTFVDDLSFSLRAPAANMSPLVFPTKQFCVGGKTAWTQRPEAGASPGSLDRPAPRLQLVGAAQGRPAQAQPQPSAPARDESPAILTYLALLSGLLGLLMSAVALRKAASTKSQKSR